MAEFVPEGQNLFDFDREAEVMINSFFAFSEFPCNYRSKDMWPRTGVVANENETSHLGILQKSW